MLPMPLVHPAFNTRLTFYMPPAALIRGPNDTLFSPLGQHILDYEPPHGFFIQAFATFDVSADPYDHMLHVEYIKGQHLYRILIPSAHILRSFCVRIGAFDHSRVFVLVQVFRVPCTLFIGVLI